MATLYIVATPIGNLSDITERALEALRSVDAIACEDTRHTRILLDRYTISTPTVSYHQHSSLQKIDYLVEELAQGKDIALVTDAGTPGISDPGGVLVAAVYEKNKSLRDPIVVCPLPGASSVMAALSVSGFPSDTFLFLGFLPKKKGRQTMMTALFNQPKGLRAETVVFFESPLRIKSTLKDLLEYKDNADKSGKIVVEVCLCRELTKKFEEIWRGSLEEAAVRELMEKGEYVVVLHIK
jgi:16S rRNA (cytidine1402-2'-O)-methyltransferase